MKDVRCEVDGGELGVGNLDAFGVFFLIQFSADFEAGLGCRRRDQLNDGAIAPQRLPPPVDGDERKEPMLDLVPFAGAGRQVADRDGSVEFVGQFLEFAGLR